MMARHLKFLLTEMEDNGEGWDRLIPVPQRELTAALTLIQWLIEDRGVVPEAAIEAATWVNNTIGERSYAAYQQQHGWKQALAREQEGIRKRLGEGQAE